MRNINPLYLTDEGEIVKDILKIDNEIQNELSNSSVDKEKLYRLRFQQLMKGIQLTQNPYDLR